MKILPILPMIFVLAACTDPMCTTPEPDAGADAAVELVPYYYRIDTVMTFHEAEAACEAQGAAIAVAEAIADLEPMFVACNALPLPVPSPYQSPPCWTGTWIEAPSGSMSVYKLEPPYVIPVGVTSLDSMLFPLCERLLPR